MEELSYKQDIISTRKGHVGGSDAKMLQSVAEAGEVPQSAMKRLAVVKGLIEPDNFTNVYMRFGDFIENEVYANLKASDERWQSNPCIVSEKYSRKNVTVIDHTDFLLQDDEKKVLTIVECKATRMDFTQTKKEYINQLQHHYLLGKELAQKLGGYEVKIGLAHYCTDGVDFDAPFEFDPSRLTVKMLRRMDRLSTSYQLSKAMDIVDAFLEHYDTYYEDETIDSALLPENVQTQFTAMVQYMHEIQEKEQKVNEFKAKLFDFLYAKNIRKIESPEYSVTVVAPTKQSSFDAKSFLADYTASHPRKAAQLKEKYNKESVKKGYVTIKLKN